MDVFDLAARITLDTKEYENALGDASTKTHSFGERLKSGLMTSAKVGAAALGAATTAVGALTKVALDSYGDYEQLVGGVKTLFGTEAESVEEYAASVGKSVSEVQGEYDKLVRSQNTVMDNAANAFQTAGLSANQYMETATAFSASLIQSLGGDTAAAAEYANMAITDMSDNANKMGTDMEMIQNAYRGFSRANFTMLDNLALGYGGTKEEMERLLEDAEKLSGVEYDISSYADIVEAIHVVQTEMGITGTTAEEAAGTMQGSLSAARASFQNLVTGISDGNADLDTLIGNFVESVSTAGKNILPRIEQILVGAGEVIQKLAPIIAEQLPPLVSTVLPSLIGAGTELLTGLLTGIISALPALVDSVPQIVDGVITALSEGWPTIQSAGSELLSMLVNGLVSNLPALVPAAVEAILQLVETFTSPESLGGFIDSALQLILALADGLIRAIPELLDKVPVIIKNLVQTIVERGPELVLAAIQLISSLGMGLVSAIPRLLSYAVQIPAAIIGAIVDGIKGIGEIGGDIVRGVWEGIKGMERWIVNNVKDFFGGIVDSVKGLLGIHSPSTVFAGIGENMALGVGAGWDDEFGKIKKNIESGLDFGETNITGTATLPASGNSPYAQKPFAFGDVFNITVNGAKYQDEQSLARVIAQEIQNMKERRLAAYATA